MAVSNKFRNVAYGLSDALLNTPSLPIVSERAPTANDKAPFGTIWVDKPNADAYIITSIVGNVATWVNAGGGSGTFTTLEVTGNSPVSATIVADQGYIQASDGDIRVIDGDFVAVGTGNFFINSGEINSATGDILVQAGDIEATLGSITGASLVATGIVGVVASIGDIEATVGKVFGATLSATGDIAGSASTTSLTNVVDTTQGVGVLSILSSNGNSGDNAGFLKIYVGTTVAYVPYFTDITP